MYRDPKAFRERFKAWKNGEQVYHGGRPTELPQYEDGKDALFTFDKNKVYNRIPGDQWYNIFNGKRPYNYGISSPKDAVISYFKNSDDYVKNRLKRYEGYKDISWRDKEEAQKKLNKLWDKYVNKGESRGKSYLDIFSKKDLKKLEILQDKSESLPILAHEDAKDVYLGLPQRYNSLKPAEYSPTQGRLDNGMYFSYMRDPGYIEDVLLPIFNDYKLNKVNKPGKKFLEEVISLPDPVGRINQITKKGNAVINIPYLANATMSHGFDPQKGEYFSIYDVWDYNTDVFGTPGDNVGKYIGGSPFEIYDRYYLDDVHGLPRTGATYLPQITVTAKKNYADGKESEDWLYDNPNYAQMLNEIEVSGIKPSWLRTQERDAEHARQHSIIQGNPFLRIPKERGLEIVSPEFDLAMSAGLIRSLLNRGANKVAPRYLFSAKSKKDVMSPLSKSDLKLQKTWTKHKEAINKEFNDFYHSEDYARRMTNAGLTEAEKKSLLKELDYTNSNSDYNLTTIPDSEEGFAVAGEAVRENGWMPKTNIKINPHYANRETLVHEKGHSTTANLESWSNGERMGYPTIQKAMRYNASISPMSDATLIKNSGYTPAKLQYLMNEQEGRARAMQIALAANRTNQPIQQFVYDPNNIVMFKPLTELSNIYRLGDIANYASNLLTTGGVVAGAASLAGDNYKNGKESGVRVRIPHRNNIKRKQQKQTAEKK